MPSCDEPLHLFVELHSESPSPRGDKASALEGRWVKPLLTVRLPESGARDPCRCDPATGL